MQLRAKPRRTGHRTATALTTRSGPSRTVRYSSLGQALLSLAVSNPNSFTRLRIERGHTLYRAGELAESIYVVERGWLKCERHTREGKTSLLDYHVPGEVLGEECLVASERADTAMAKAPAVVWSIRGKELLALVSRSDMTNLLIAHMSERLGSQRELIVQFTTASSEQRLAMRLLMLARRIGREEGNAVVIPYRLTHEDLAKMVGTTRSRVGFFLKGFKDAGLIRQDGKGLLIHPQRMSRFLEVQADLTHLPSLAGIVTSSVPA
jgi:CRP-like cAMP-binding protein